MLNLFQRPPAQGNKWFIRCASLCTRWFAAWPPGRRRLILTGLLAMELAPSCSWGGEVDLPQPLYLNDAVSIAREHRAEISAARSLAQAAAVRPAIVSALEDPMIFPSIDHQPVDPMMSADRSIAIEQRFPLPGVRSHKRQAAEAEADRLQSQVERTVLDVELEAARSYLMLHERRQMQQVLEKQLILAGEVIQAATARYSAGTNAQAEVLRAEIDLARIKAMQSSQAAEVAAAEVMLNTSLGRNASLPIPELADNELPSTTRTPALDAAQEEALKRRPEINGSNAEIRRARAEVQVMKSMNLPMFMVRTGVADTMTAGRGYMLMVGISLPIWQGRVRAGVSEARAMEAMAMADQQAMRSMVAGETAAAIEVLRGALARYQAIREDVLPRAERSVAPSLSAYSSGQLTLAGVLETAQAVWAVREEAITAEFELGMAWAQLHSVIGDLGEPL